MNQKKTKEICTSCGKKTVNGIHPIFEKVLCLNCSREHTYITKSTIKSDYRLNSRDIENLKCLEVDNPHYKVAPSMKLYLLEQVERIAQNKYGNNEPYKVLLLERPEEFYQLLLQDITRFHQITPGDFQLIIAERLEKAGFNVNLIGNVYESDGGIDLIATPKNSLFPYLLPVQCKHHRTARKTTAGDVRDFFGAINSRQTPFSLGLIVTNTTFTPDAEFFAKNNSHLLRLRDIRDLTKWLKNDFDNESNWREIPDKIILPNNKEIAIPKDRIWIPK